MPFPLQKVPLGLLQLFALQTNGRLPTEFGEQVVPMVDVADFYGADRLLPSSISSGAGAFPRATNTTPIGSTIRVHQITAQLALGAAGAANAYYSCQVRLQSPDGIQIGLFPTQLLVAPAAGFNNGAIFDFGGQLPYPRVLPPGWVIATSINSNDPMVAATLALRFSFENIIGA